MSRVGVVKSLFAFTCVALAWAPLSGSTAKDGVKAQPRLAHPFRQGGVFSEIMVPLSEPSSAETAEFARAVCAYQVGGDPIRVKPLLEFLGKNPRSPWAGTAHMALGMIYREAKQPALAAASFRRAQGLFDVVAETRKGAMGMADWAAIEAAEQEAKRGEMGGLVRVANRLTGRVASTSAAPTLVGGRRFEYDVENRIVSITMGSHITEFEYDPAGFLSTIREKDNGQVTSDKRYLWDATTDTMVAEQTSDGATLREFYPQGFIDSDGTALFYTRDHLGSTRELVDSQGIVRARYDYDPWGRATKVLGDKDSPFLFTGHLWHDQSRLFLTKYRAYDPSLGRWTQRDPVANPTMWLAPNTDGIFRGNAVDKIIARFEPELLPDGYNIYAYVGNNPINRFDLLGLQSYDSCSQAIMNCMRMPTAAARIACLEDVLGALDEGASDKVIKQAKDLLDQQRRLLKTAEDILSKEIKGSAQREFPGQFRDRTLEQIQKLAQSGDRAAKTAWKLLNDLRFRR